MIKYKLLCVRYDDLLNHLFFEGEIVSDPNLV